ncbi:MAG TPA: ATP-binding cassette domain-containing protein, partial [Geminicoccaceae bacterium]|nr:ATP-binding cassette domain-containing protein [Geminicoccaceae bacterium]
MTKPSVADGQRVLEATGLERHYTVRRGMFRGSAVLQALRGVSFELRAGRTLAVVGESGCGKSTLARLVTLIEPPSAGRLTIDGIDVARLSSEERRRLRHTVQIVFQDPYGSLNPRKKVGTILEEPIKVNTK